MNISPNNDLMVHQWSQSAIQTDFPSVKTLEELISIIQNQLRDQGQVVCEIVVNGMHISESDEKKFSNSLVGEVQDLTIKSSAPLALLRDSLKSIVELADGLVSVLETSGRMFRDFDISKAHAFYLNCVETMHWFSQLVGNYKGAHEVIVGPLPEWFGLIPSEIENRLKEILEAFVNKNYILVADVLEHEFSADFLNWVDRIQRELVSKGALKTEASSQCEVEGAPTA